MNTGSEFTTISRKRLSMTTYSALKLIHILAGITAVGANLTYPSWLIRGRTNSVNLRFTFEGIRFLENWIANPSYIISLLTGLIMCRLAGISIFSIAWIRYALILYALMSAIGFLVYTPILRRQVSEFVANGATSSRYVRLNKLQTMFGLILYVFALLILYLMIIKPV